MSWLFLHGWACEYFHINGCEHHTRCRVGGFTHKCTFKHTRHIVFNSKAEDLWLKSFNFKLHALSFHLTFFGFLLCGTDESDLPHTPASLSSSLLLPSLQCLLSSSSSAFVLALVQHFFCFLFVVLVPTSAFLISFFCKVSPNISTISRVQRNSMYNSLHSTNWREEGCRYSPHVGDWV